MDAVLAKLHGLKIELGGKLGVESINDIYLGVLDVVTRYKFPNSYIKRLESMQFRDLSSSMRENKVILTRITNDLIGEFEHKIHSPNNPQCDYVIITALEDDEMENILPIFTREGKIDSDKHLIEYGHLTSDPRKSIAWSSQSTTGMIDASILATEMIMRFNPKFLIMPGVLGGKPGKTNMGDIIVSTKIFTIDKGKITNGHFAREIESENVTSSYVTSFQRYKKKAISFIKSKALPFSENINIYFEPIATVRQVIDSKDFFAKKISVVDRKAIALEMESYGVARACELVNNGRTIPIIVKAVMDNTLHKTDGSKSYAAKASALFVQFILTENLI